MKKNSLLIHGGISIDEKTGAVNQKIFQFLRLWPFSAFLGVEKIA